MPTLVCRMGLGLMFLGGVLVTRTDAMVEDLCIGSPGKNSTSGIYNYYTKAAELGCGYNEKTPLYVHGIIHKVVGHDQRMREDVFKFFFVCMQDRREPIQLPFNWS